MRRMPRDACLRAVYVLRMGRGRRQEANAVNVSKSVVSILWDRYQQTKYVDDQPSSGRPRATTGVQDQFIRNQALRN